MTKPKQDEFDDARAALEEYAELRLAQIDREADDLEPMTAHAFRKLEMDALSLKRRALETVIRYAETK